MSRNIDICRICLRIDRKLIIVHHKLSNFHNEITCYSNLTDEVMRYCLECKYLLKKMYNFKQKCMMADRILNTWKCAEATSINPVHELYTFLPTSKLSIWNEKNYKTYSYIYQENLDNVLSRNSKDNKTNNESLLNRMDNDSNLKEGNYNHLNIGENILTINIGDDVSIRHAEIIKEPNFHSNVVLLPMDSAFYHDDDNISMDNDQNPIIEIKKEIETTEDVNTLQNILKIEESMEFDENSLKNKNEYQIKNNSVEINDFDDNCTIFSVNEKNNLGKNEKQNKLKSNLTIKAKRLQKNEVTKLNNVNIYTKRKRLTRKSKPQSATNRNIVDNDNNILQHNDKDHINMQDNDINNINKQDNDMDNINILDNDKKDSDDETLNKLSKNIGHSAKLKKKEKKQRFHTKKYIIAELTSGVDLGEKNRQTKCSEELFSKKRLKADLVAKFEKHGKLKTDDGEVIDAHFILSCIDDKVTEFVLKQLWDSVYGKKALKPKALKLLKGIQNKYKNVYDSVFEIEYLNTKEKMLEEFERRKTYACYVDAEYKCERCYQGFKHEKKLDYHKQCHDVSAGEFICSICGVRQQQRKNLVSHMNNCHEAVYKCKRCPLITYYKSSMVNHYKLHEGVKFRCEPCDVTFGSQSAYRNHVSYRHTRRHACPACGRAFLTIQGLKWHTTREHQEDTGARGVQIHCSQCPLTFNTQNARRRHTLLMHDSTDTTLDSNTRIRKPKKKPVMTCRVCSATGSSSGWLNLHFSMEHPEEDLSQIYADRQTHLCHVCGKGFTTIYSLKAHIITHSELRPYACKICPKRFHRAISLQQHQLFHLPPNKTCGYCSKKFRSQSNLTNHVRFHIGDRRYKCKICGKGFLHRNTLNEHVRGVHNNVRRVRKKGGDNRRGLEEVN